MRLRALSCWLVLGSLALVHAAPLVYELNPAHTRPTFDVIRLGFLHTPGVFADATGELTLDPDTKVGSIEVVIKTASLTTGSASRDAYLKGPEFFNVAMYPTATVTAKDFSLDGHFPARVDGTMTMLGISKPIALTLVSMQCDAANAGQKAVCHGQVSTRIQRSEWGMSRYQLFVANTVTIDVAVEAVSR